MTTDNLARDREILARSIRSTILGLRARGTVAMGMANLRQIVPTRGLTCLPGQYRAMFDELTREASEKLNFPILE